MNCKQCRKNVSIKDSANWVSILCKCNILLIYGDKAIKIISKEEYKETYNHGN